MQGQRQKLVDELGKKKLAGDGKDVGGGGVGTGAGAAAAQALRAGSSATKKNRV